MAYIGRSGDTTIKDRTGRELSVGEQADFISQPESYEITRPIIVSPDRGDELSDVTMQETFSGGRPGEGPRFARGGVHRAVAPGFDERHLEYFRSELLDGTDEE